MDLFNYERAEAIVRLVLSIALGDLSYDVRLLFISGDLPPHTQLRQRHSFAIGEPFLLGLLCDFYTGLYFLRHARSHEF